MDPYDSILKVPYKVSQDAMTDNLREHHGSMVVKQKEPRIWDDLGVLRIRASGVSGI